MFRVFHASVDSEMKYFLLFTLACVEMSHSHHFLIADLLSSEHIDVVILFQCNTTQLFSLIKYLNIKGLRSLQIIDTNSSRFYMDHERFMYTDHHRFGLVLDLSCPRVDELLVFCSSHAYFNASYSWFLLAEGSNADSGYELLDTLNINIDSRVTIAVEQDREFLNYNLYDVYGTIKKRGGKVHILHAGVWNITAGLRRIRPVSYRRSNNLNGIYLWAAITTLGAPRNVSLEEYLRSLTLPRRYSSDRFGYRISTLLSYHLNFSIKFITTKGWSLETLGTNSTSGVIDQMQQNLVDFSSSPSELRKERLTSYDQTVPMTAGKFLTVFRHPKNTRTRNVFLEPFCDVLWITVSMVLLIASIILLTNFYMERKLDCIYNCQFMLAVLGFFCQQGYSGKASSCVSRIAILSAIVFSVILFQFYTSFMISSLLMLPPKTIRTMDQLLASDLKYSIENLPYNRDFFNKTNRTVLVQLYKRKVLPNKFGFVNISTGIELVKRGGYAFHCDLSYGNTWIMETFEEREICQLQELVLYPFRPLHIVVPKGSPLKELFTVTLRKLLETGLAQYYRRKFYVDRPQCMTRHFASGAISFLDISSLYWMLAAGCALAKLILTLEVIVSRVKINLNKKTVKNYHAWID
ncbi:ionotropic receptor 75a-like isoform X2 [Toxorhynchites rutilus septentrionalis]|uniref:ionotropic receptor 75a-like isoform X2 n=1 Tax=Toxorhynchites rutilus septentrionalis TaxID=329112 RepID=UPI00247A7186|nr:ionotropic receptor 75a-like isoform X2 [Toxorhynchites rutilus septentrionalis]